MSTLSGSWISCDAALCQLSGKLQGDCRATYIYSCIPLRIFNKKQPAEDCLRTTSISPLCNHHGLALISQFIYLETIVEYYKTTKTTFRTGLPAVTKRRKYNSVTAWWDIILWPLCADKYSLKGPFVGQIRNGINYKKQGAYVDTRIDPD